MPSGGSCILSAINLAEFANEDDVNVIELANTVKEAVTYMNEVLDEGLQYLPLKGQVESSRDWRQIGIGIMGWADLLIKLKIKYGSPESIALADRIGNVIASTAIRQSINLAKEYGAYPNYSDKVLESEFFKEHIKDEATINLAKEYGLRNSQVLTVAP